MDASTQAKIIKLLLNLQEKRGISILFISHNLALARKISDRIAVMLAGRIVEEGQSNEVVEKPLHPYTRDLLKVAPTLTPHVPEVPEPRSNYGKGCPYASRCAEAMKVCFKKKTSATKLWFSKVACLKMKLQ